MKSDLFRTPEAPLPAVNAPQGAASHHAMTLQRKAFHPSGLHASANHNRVLIFSVLRFRHALPTVRFIYLPTYRIPVRSSPLPQGPRTKAQCPGPRSHMLQPHDISLIPSVCDCNLQGSMGYGPWRITLRRGQPLWRRRLQMGTSLSSFLPISPWLPPRWLQIIRAYLLYTCNGWQGAARSAVPSSYTHLVHTCVPTLHGSWVGMWSRSIIPLPAALRVHLKNLCVRTGV